VSLPDEQTATLLRYIYRFHFGESWARSPLLLSVCSPCDLVTAVSDEGRHLAPDGSSLLAIVMKRSSMTPDIGSIRSELSGKFKSPIDVLLDPSLFISNALLKRLSESTVFKSQTQATLLQPTKPQIGELYIPATFRELIENDSQLDIQQTSAWNFFRGQSEGALREEIIDALDQNNVSKFSIENQLSDLRWRNALDDNTRTERLEQILSEEYTFLQSGGVLLSRTPRAIRALRDAGVPTLDLGKAELEPDVYDTLTDIGYKNPATSCAFGVTTADATVDVLVGDVLSANSELLLYELGD